MNYRKPQFREIDMVVIPQFLNELLNMESMDQNEVGGFLYGIYEGDSVYLAHLLRKMEGRTSDERLSPKRFQIEGMDGRAFVRRHNGVVEQGLKHNPHYIWVPYHTHPALNLEDFSKKEIQQFEKKARNLGTNLPIEEIVEGLDNRFLSQEDIRFARQFGCFGLTIIVPGEQGDPRTKRKDAQRTYFHKEMQKRFRNIFRKESYETRAIAYQVNRQREVLPVRIEVAEQSGDYEDEARIRDAFESNPAYILEMLEMFRFETELPAYKQIIEDHKPIRFAHKVASRMYGLLGKAIYSRKESAVEISQTEFEKLAEQNTKDKTLTTKI